MVFATSASEGERPSRTALVESPISAARRPRQARASAARRSERRLIGVGSIFQSPVCSTVPAEVWIASAWDSGIGMRDRNELDTERPEIDAAAGANHRDRDLRRVALGGAFGREQSGAEWVA